MDSQELSPSWSDLLATASTAGEVLAIAQEFMARLSFIERALLPDGCRPRRLVVPSDLGSLAYDLARAQVDPGSDAERVVRKASAFLSDCALRLAVLSNPRSRFFAAAHQHPPPSVLRAS